MDRCNKTWFGKNKKKLGTKSKKDQRFKGGTFSIYPSQKETPKQWFESRLD